jgi:TPR repeat protein
MPEHYRSKQEGVAVLGEMAKAGYVHARYELANFYLLQILEYNGEGKPVPDEWYVRARKHAEAAVEAGYSGGYYMKGYMDHYGSGIPEPDLESAAACYAKALEVAGQGYFELAVRADAAFNLGSMLYGGEGVARDRRKGVELVAEAARLGNWLAKEWLEDNEKTVARDGVMAPPGDVAYDPGLIDPEKIMNEDEEAERRARMYGETTQPPADGEEA